MPAAPAVPDLSAEDERLTGAAAADSEPPDSGVDPKVPKRPSPVPPAPGSAPQRKIGRCELFTQIAHGGMATIHLGRWVGAGGFVKTVAVKALHPQYARDDEFVKMFLDEARVVARIRHPNVMPTIDLVEEDGELFIVMEFIEGVTLSHLMKRMRKKKRAVPVNMALRIMTGVLFGLHAAHEAKDERGESLCVIHRDVSPENILVGIDGYARLIDFGIASALGRHTRTRAGQVKGKLSYLTPEQVLGDELTRRSDVFSAASVLWHALVGRKLFKAKSIAEISMAILNEAIEPPSKANSDLSGKYDSIVMRGLERNVDKRWPTAERMAEAIEALGGMASHRQVGEWVRSLASEKLAKTAAILKAVENAPKTTSAKDLERPLSIHPAPPEATPDGPPPPVEAWNISEEDESRTDVTAGTDAPRISAPERTQGMPRGLLAGLGALALVVIVILVITGGDDETAPAGQASATPTTTDQASVATASSTSTAPETVAPAESVSTDAAAATGPGGAGGTGGSAAAGGAGGTEPAASASASADEPKKPKKPKRPKKPKKPKAKSGDLIPDDI
ncbi:MAG: serine/threonine protein kinase [Deltaproteobacteria bacterium]|nr:serine/threonine protein kinase [Deltaproteobacteria bacterium]